MYVWSLSRSSAQLVGKLIPGAHGEGGVAVGAVQALAALDDCNLAAGCADGGVALWNIKERSCEVVLRGHLGPVHALAALPKGELASGGADCGVRIWCTWDCVCQRELRGHSAPVRSVASVDGGTVLASGAEDASLRLWSVASGECLTHVPGTHARARLLALCALPNSRLASAADDAVLAVWQPQAAARDASMRWSSVSARGGPTVVTHLLLLTPAYAVAGCTDGTLRLWRTEDGEAVAMLQADDGGDDEFAVEVAVAAVTALALAGGGATLHVEERPRANCGPVRVRDRLWCFAGGERLF
jgi:WD40 repeat protein